MLQAYQVHGGHVYRLPEGFEVDRLGIVLVSSLVMAYSPELAVWEVVNTFNRQGIPREYFLSMEIWVTRRRDVEPTSIFSLDTYKRQDYDEDS